MQFKEKLSIYRQIADHIYDQILTGRWVDDGRILSIRDMSIQMEVNPNTMTRAYGLLQDQGVIYNRRGIGYFTSKDASSITRGLKKKEFITSVLPEMFSNMTSLKMSIEELQELYTDFKEKNHEDE